ncbi:FAD/NAD(P)-binding domain-containing protein, partial [Leucosporidium creatinivorum]
GLVGLLLAQGLTKRGIPNTVYERDPDQGGRTQGFAITLHWILNAIEQMLPKELFDQLDNVQVDPFLAQDKGNFLVLDGRDLGVLYKIPPSKKRVRANRTKLRALLLQGLNVEYEKKFERFETIEGGGVRAHFADGTIAEGTLLVGTDGNNSRVRQGLFKDDPSAAKISSIPIVTHGVVQRYTPEQVAPLRELDPLLFQAIHPELGHFLCKPRYSIQEIDPAGKYVDILTMVSHKVTDLALEVPKDANSVLKIRDMKARAVGFAEPLFSLINDIDESLPCTTISLADWVPTKWDNLGCVTVAGDATGPMTMYRGEGVNHGMLDAALLVSALTKVEAGELSQKEALDIYETEVRIRRESAIPLSRQAAIDAHGLPAPDSPVVGARAPPPIALGVF